MSRPEGRRRDVFLLVAVCGVAGWLAGAKAADASGPSGSELQTSAAPTQSPEESAHVKVRLREVDERVEIRRADDGSLNFVLRTHDGGVLVLTPEEFAQRVHAEQSRQAWWNRLLNITSPIGIAWVGLGFLGQLLFTGRMLAQWLVSEKERRSVVPTAFWWLSLGGASMLIVYFVWRKDIVGVLGQATGWIIYLRNLWFIYRANGSAPGIAEDPAPEPEMAQS